MDPILNFPHGGTVGNVGLPSIGVGLARMKKRDHPALTALAVALTIEYQRSRVTLAAECPARLTVVVDCDFDGSGAIFRAGRRLETSAAADREVSRGAVLQDKNVERSRIGEFCLGGGAPDPEATVAGISEVRGAVSPGVHHFVKDIGAKGIS